MTGREEQHDSAHIVPVEEDQWFHANRMTDYVLDPGRQSQSAISDVNNQLLLRRDLHQSFDKAKKFAFVPKKPCAGSSNMVTHLLSPSKEYGLLYHNTLTRSLDAVPREYLFARFAWAILPRVEPFLLCEIPRLLVTVANGQQVFKPDECKGFTVSRGKRSGTGSPKKRQRSKNAGDQKEQCDLDERDTKNVKVRRMMPVSTPSELALPIASGDPITTVKDKGKSSTTALAMEEDSASASYHPNAATTRPNQTTPSNTTRNDEFSDREYLYSIREHALQTERDKSDPYGEWNDEFEWAMDILRNEHSANNLRAWEDLDEARRILGEVDDSRDWVEYEDDRRHRCDVRQEQ